MTLNDVSHPLHLSIYGRLLAQDEKLTKEDGDEFIVELLGVSLEDVDWEVNDTYGDYARGNFLAHEFNMCLHETTHGVHASGVVETDMNQQFAIGLYLLYSGGFRRDVVSPQEKGVQWACY